MDVRWIVDTTAERDYSVGKLAAAVRGAGLQVHETKYTSQWTPPEPLVFDTEEPVVVHGCHGFLRKLRKHHRNYIGIYCTDANLTVAAYSVFYGDLLLNNDYVIVPFAEFVRRKRFWYARWGGLENNSVFLRPNSGTKVFAGLCIPLDDFDHEVNALTQISSVMPDTLVVVSSPKRIEAEFRFIIADRKVVAGSEYRWDNKLDIRTDYPDAAFKLAQEVAQRGWQPDPCYTCDVAWLGDDEYRVIEINSFSCAGLYMCDHDAIVKAVSEATLRQWRLARGEIDDLDP